MNVQAPQELRITVTGRVPLPADLFAQARVIAGVEAHINAMKAAAGPLEGGDFRVDAVVVPAGAVPPGAVPPALPSAPLSVAELPPAAPAATIVRDGRTRVPVYAADGTVVSSYIVLQNASVRLVELIDACATIPDLDALMDANEHAADWPTAVRDVIFKAAGDREGVLVAAGKAGA